MPTSYTTDKGIYSYWRAAGRWGANPTLASHPAGPGDPPTANPPAASLALPPQLPAKAGELAEDDVVDPGKGMYAAEQLNGYLQVLEGRPPGAAAASSSLRDSSRAAAAEQLATAQAAAAAAAAVPVRPVFRVAPYAAELARQRQSQSTVRILFLDEGG